MASTYRIRAMAAVAVALAFTSSASAETHYVQIYEYAFFPETTYLSSGDTVHFTNRSFGIRNILGEKKSWKSGDIERNGTFTYSVDSKTPLEFVATDGEKESEINFTGGISFDAPPLTE